jgi:isoleucyl-tRNA synthetase
VYDDEYTAYLLENLPAGNHEIAIGKCGAFHDYDRILLWGEFDVDIGGSTAPYKTVLTHGWTVDGEGKAMHKSIGNTVDPLDMVKKYGAELVRLWVASTDYRVDVRVSDAIFKQLSETYRKIRNTARILLANLGGFDPNTDMVELSELLDIDKWALARTNELIKTCREAYDNYEFHVIYHAINNFCTTDMSKLYVDITKDRMYTEKTESVLRRSAQSAMWLILSALTRLAAPLISFTAEEIWQSMEHLDSDKKESVFLNDLPAANAAWEFSELAAKWDRLFELRDDVMKALEIARADKLIGKSLDAKVTVFTNDKETFELLDSFKSELPAVYIVSAAEIVLGNAPEGAFAEEGGAICVLVEVANGERCDRCWLHSTECVSDGEGHLCPRCRAIVEG